MNKSIFSVESNDSVFSKLMPIYMKESQQLVRRKFEFKIEVETKLCLSCEEVLIRLSDPNDPFFLYMTSINEQIFNKIKSSENLLIDFISFPKTLINLFETCFDEQNKDNPRFMVSLNQMNKDFIILDIIETNVFKHLLHFSLRIPSANPELIKTNFTNNYRTVKLENERLENSLRSLELKLTETQLLRTQELDSIRIDYKNQLKDMEIKFKTDIEKQKQLINELNDKDLDNCKQIQELRKQLTINFENVRQQQRVESEKDLQLITDLNRKISSLELQLSGIKEQYETERIEKTKFKDLCSEKQDLLDEINLSNNSLTQDLSKANEIIRKLQTEMQSTHQKLQLLNKVTSKQEEAVDQHQSAVQKLESDLRLCSQQLTSRDKEYQCLRKDFEALKNKCSETESQLNANQNIITYLNQQISELQTRHGIKTITAGALSKTTQPKVVDKTSLKTNPKVTASQRNALFSTNSTKIDQLFKR